MPLTVSPPTAPSSCARLLPPGDTTADGDTETAAGAEAGVIRDARRRQRRRRTLGVALGAAAAALLAFLIGGHPGHPGAPGELWPPGSAKLALIHGRALRGGQPAIVGVTFSLQPGNVGVCTRVADHGGCSGPLPSPAWPVYDGGEGFDPEEKVGPEGQIDALFTDSKVAAVRVAHLGTFRTEVTPGLPPGAREVIFYRPPGARGSVLPPGVSPDVLAGFEHARHGPALTETLLDAAGRPIAVHRAPSFQLPNSYWQAPHQPPAGGRCALRSSLPGAREEWGEVATAIAPDRDIATHGWLSCLDAWYSRAGTSYEAAVLLDARAPGSPPALLWGAVPLAGHPGVFEIPPVQREVHIPITPAQAAELVARQTSRFGRAYALRDLREIEQPYWEVFVPRTLARRVGDAWLLVRDGRTLTDQLRFLQALRVTRIDLARRR